MNKHLKALDDLYGYLKDRKDFALGEEEHVDASKALCLIDDLRCALKKLPVQVKEEEVA